MQEIFLSLIKQLNTSIFVLMALLMLMFFALYKLGRWSEKFFHHEEKIKSLGTMSEKIIVMQTKIDLIYQYVNPNSPIRALSPISLTAIGEEIANTINANKILKKYVAKLIQEIDLENPQNAYDIQIASMKIAKENLMTFLNEKELNLIKQAAYAKGILVEDIFTLFGVLLRNHILNERGIPISDVDKHSGNDN